MKKILALLLLVPGIALAGRNTGGTYSFPSNVYPVAAGQKITSSWANAMMADLASALTDSLSRTGNGGMQSTFLLPQGTISSPGLSFTGASSTGIYLVSPTDLRLSLAGVDGLRVTGSSAATMSLYVGPYRVPNWFDVSIFYPGKPGGSQLLARFTFTGPTRVEQPTASAVGFIGAAPTNAWVLSVAKRTPSGTNSIQIGTITFNAGSRTVSSIAFSADTDFVAGDMLEIYAPVAQDVTATDISVAIRARRL